MAVTVTYQTTPIGGDVNGDFQTNTYDNGEQLLPDVLGLSGGGFVSAYNNVSPLDGFILLNFYRADHSLIGTHREAFDNNDTDAFLQPKLTELSNGNVVVVWDDNNTTDGDAGPQASIFTDKGAVVAQDINLGASVGYPGRRRGRARRRRLRAQLPGRREHLVPAVQRGRGPGGRPRHRDDSRRDPARFPGHRALGRRLRRHLDRHQPRRPAGQGPHLRGQRNPAGRGVHRLEQRRRQHPAEHRGGAGRRADRRLQEHGLRRERRRRRPGHLAGHLRFRGGRDQLHPRQRGAHRRRARSGRDRAGQRLHRGDLDPSQHER